MLVTFEAFALGEKLGVDWAVLQDDLDLEWQFLIVQHGCPMPGAVADPASNEFKPGFMAKLMLKDLRLARGGRNGGLADTDRRGGRGGLQRT